MAHTAEEIVLSTWLNELGGAMRRLASRSAALAATLAMLFTVAIGTAVADGHMEKRIPGTSDPSLSPGRQLIGDGLPVAVVENAAVAIPADRENATDAATTSRGTLDRAQPIGHRGGRSCDADSPSD